MELRIHFAHLFFGPFLHAEQLMLPITLKRSRPFVQRADSFGIGSIEFVTAFAADADQTDASQDAQVLGDRGLIEIQGCHNFPYRALPECKITQNLSSARLGDCVEGVGGGGCSCHGEKYTYSYRNMSRFYLMLGIENCGKISLFP